MASKRILLTDDSALFRLKLSDVLAGAGHQITTAIDGKDCTRKIEAARVPFDLLILDIEMPELDGFGVIEWLKETYRFKELPVLVITGVYEKPGIQERLDSLGIIKHMSKEASPEETIYRVNKALFPSGGGDAALERVPTSIAADFTSEDDTHTGFILNMSVTGLFLETELPLIEGSEIKMRMSLPGSRKTIEFEGTIKRMTGNELPTGRFSGAGVMYKKLSPSDAMAIREFVNAETKRLNPESKE